ncbi:MAG: winged helix-turn-helix domain-containing protein [Candidatus Thiodiazotropha endolucinida]|nr:winged helix-turn-helix domain-containing protein [Candidatus Thiodiazotropha endolucinida]
MEAHDRIQKQIDKKLKDISDLEEKKRKMINEINQELAEAKGVITGLEEALKFLPKGTNLTAFENEVRSIRKGSDIEKVYLVLKDEGEPRHIEWLLKAIGKEVNKKTRQALSGQLSYNYREGRIFTRPAPNTFGLIQWPNNIEDDQTTDGDIQESMDIPSSFGRDD